MRKTISESSAHLKIWIKKAYESTEIEISKKAEEFWNKHELWNY
jgi:hypothetical protein